MGAIPSTSRSREKQSREKIPIGPNPKRNRWKNHRKLWPRWLKPIQGPDKENDLPLPQLPPEMLLEIFSWLPRSEILRLRLLNHSWSSTASFLYRDRDLDGSSSSCSSESSAKIPEPPSRPVEFKCHGRSQTYWRLSSGGGQDLHYSRIFTLSQLTATIRASSNPAHLPFTKFHFPFPLRESPDLLEFLTVYGPHILSLSLKSGELSQRYRADEAAAKLGQLLFHYVSNLNDLKLSRHLTECSSARFFPAVTTLDPPFSCQTQVQTNRQLPHLKRLVLSGTPGQLVADIKQSATCLQECINPNSSGLDSISQNVHDSRLFSE